MKKKGEDSFLYYLFTQCKQLLAPILIMLLASILIPLIPAIIINTSSVFVSEIELQRIMQVVSTVLMFGAPALAYAYTSKSGLLHSLKADNIGSWHSWLMLLIFIVSAIPTVNCISAINENIHFPESMSIIEQSLRNNHEKIAMLTEQMLSCDNFSDLMINVLIIGLIPALCEELFFRGCVQNSLSRHMNIHASIWITSIIFSVLHFQFFAFLPRFIMSAAYGYILHRSGSLWLTITAHFINNSSIVIMHFLNRQYSADINYDTWGAGNDEFVFAIAGFALAIFAISRMIPYTKETDLIKEPKEN